MKRVLVVSPRFAPSSGADTHRVRMSLPWFGRWDWEPAVLRVAAREDPGVQDALLLRTLPDHLEIVEAGALPLRRCAPLGLSDLALRAWPSLYRQGLRLIARNKPALVFFSTTSFLAMTLGPAWLRATGTPFVVDIQDMWANEAPPLRQGPKHALMRRAHAWAEARTLPRAAGIIAVSQGYIDRLRARYAPLAAIPAEAIPFGASQRDFAVLARSGLRTRLIERRDGVLNVVYAGVAADNMRTALRILFRALRGGLDSAPALFSRMRLLFVGTVYPPGAPRSAIARIAAEERVSEFVREQPGRIAYLETLQLLCDADLLLVPGVQEGEYVPSKVLPYLLSGTPMLTVMHERSALRELLARVPTGLGSAWFDPARPLEPAIAECRRLWEQLATRNERRPAGVLDPALQAYSVEALTGRICALFDRALAHA